MMLAAREKRLYEVAGARQEGCVIFEDIHDPHNAAAAFRTAEGFGFGEIHLIFAAEPRFNSRRVGKATSSSANKWLDFTAWESTARCLAALKRRGYTIYATVCDPAAPSLFKTPLRERKIALLFGNEHRGLSAEAIRLADRRIAIPLRGMVQSFNLSVTAGICLAELTRRRLARDMKRYLLSPARRAETLRQWIRVEKYPGAKRGSPSNPRQP